MVLSRIFALLMMMLVVVGFAQAQPVLIKPGDTIQLICAEESSINHDYKVTSDGLILVDFLGAVKIGGLTETQAADKVAKQLLDEKILKKATISIKLINPEIKTVKFGGTVAYEAETPWRANMKLSDVIHLAELKPDADLTNIQIKSESGAVKIADFSKDEDPLLAPGDSITFFAKKGSVPTIPVDPTNPTNPTNPNIPVQPGTTAQVTLVGKVTLPGNYDLTSNMTVRELIVKCGGFTEGADLNAITLERAGAKRTLRLPADNDFALQAGDIITIDQRTRPKTFVIVEGSVRRPGRIEINEGTKLSEVIKLAGGFMDGARQDRIKIFSTANEKPREINFEDIILGYRGDLEMQPGQTIEIPGPKPSTTLAFGPKERVTAGAIALLLLFGS
jgi:protein involved in polysaccharide export with SLBB domain